MEIRDQNTVDGRHPAMQAAALAQLGRYEEAKKAVQDLLADRAR